MGVLRGITAGARNGSRARHHHRCFCGLPQVSADCAVTEFGGMCRLLGLGLLGLLRMENSTWSLIWASMQLDSCSLSDQLGGNRGCDLERVWGWRCWSVDFMGSDSCVRISMWIIRLHNALKLIEVVDNTNLDEHQIAKQPGTVSGQIPSVSLDRNPNNHHELTWK